MNKLKLLFKEPTKTFENKLSQKINWLRIFLLFSVNGIMYIHLLMKSGGYYDFGSKKGIFSTIMSLITMGIVYGITSNLILGFLIKLTGKFFNAKNELKTIYNAIGIAYIPLYISLILLFTNLAMAGILLLEVGSVLALLLSGLIIIFTLIQGGVSIWQFILLYKGLRVAQNLNGKRTILNYLSGVVIFGLIHFFLLNPYL
ncbi:Yip1-like protein [Salegentibacter sp. 24]|uniref:Yip1 family protein n=1 Tax=Salegentibacter sp. 24 TaxID=2183986 RepID=UPI00105D68C3|nr:Yip1 family protein [Salegentibacter sp. 24]TDN79077.1 Yip1-like protein [Salegentibacter sp. 24]